MIEKVFTHLKYARRAPRKVTSNERKKALDSYNGQIIKSEKVRIWYDHFKKTGEKLDIKKMEINTERIKHLFMYD